MRKAGQHSGVGKRWPATLAKTALSGSSPQRVAYLGWSDAGQGGHLHTAVSPDVLRWFGEDLKNIAQRIAASAEARGAKH